MPSNNAERSKNYRNRKKDSTLKIKKTPLTFAERSRMYRLRKKLNKGIKSSVNEVLYTPSTSNSRMTFEPSPQPVTTATLKMHCEAETFPELHQSKNSDVFIVPDIEVTTEDVAMSPIPVALKIPTQIPAATSEPQNKFNLESVSAKDSPSITSTHEGAHQPSSNSIPFQSIASISMPDVNSLPPGITVMYPTNSLQLSSLNTIKTPTAIIIFKTSPKIVMNSNKNLNNGENKTNVSDSYPLGKTQCNLKKLDPTKITTTSFPQLIKLDKKSVVNQTFLTSCSTVSQDSKPEVKNFLKHSENEIYQNYSERISNLKYPTNKTNKRRTVSKNNHKSSDDKIDESINKSTKINRKPPFSYSQLIVQAISSSPNGKSRLSDIYSYIAQNYSYYENRKQKWQNAIRHTLSISKNFIKVLKTNEEVGKGNYWKIDPRVESKVTERAFQKRRRQRFQSLIDTGCIFLSPKYINNSSDESETLDIKIENVYEVTPTSSKEKAMKMKSTHVPEESINAHDYKYETCFAEDIEDRNSDNVTDEIEHPKPPFSYSQLIMQAIASSPEGQLTCSEIFSSIMKTHKFYRANLCTWQSSIRRALCTQKDFFSKVPNQLGKDCSKTVWKLNSQCESALNEQAFTWRLRRGLPCFKHPLDWNNLKNNQSRRLVVPMCNIFSCSRHKFLVDKYLKSNVSKRFMQEDICERSNFTIENQSLEKCEENCETHIQDICLKIKQEPME